ncbi:MAG: adenosine-specific kinase [bacterium]
MPLHTIRVENPRAHNLVVGQSNLTETIDQIHAALVGTVPGIKFGLAFNVLSVPNSVKATGTDDTLIGLARKNAECIGAGQTFVLLLENAQPIRVMKALKQVSQIQHIYCATNHSVEFIVVENANGRGVMGLLGSISSGSELA